MIHKLLDEAYWDEFPILIQELENLDPDLSTNIDRSYDSSWSYILFVDMFFDAYLFDEKIPYNKKEQLKAMSFLKRKVEKEGFEFVRKNMLKYAEARVEQINEVFNYLDLPDEKKERNLVGMRSGPLTPDAVAFLKDLESNSNIQEVLNQAIDIKVLFGCLLNDAGK